MQKEELLKSLNWFMFLEKEQMELYQNQSKLVDDPYLAKALYKFGEIEQGHIDNISRTINDLGGSPTEISQITVTALGEVAKWVGSAAARLTDWTGLENLLRIDIMAEKKAMSDYRALLDKVEDPAVKELLLGNLVEEDLHTKWLEAKLEEITSTSS